MSMNASHGETEAVDVPTVPRMVGHRDAIAAMAATPPMLEAVLGGLPAALLDRRPAPDEWSAREILSHMLVVERLLLDRVEAMIATDAGPTHPTTEVVATQPAARELLAQWRDARQVTLARLLQLTQDDLRHGAVLPRYGRISVEEQVCEWAYHDLEHLRQLLADAEALLYPAIGGFTALYQAPYPTLALGATAS